jgi:hypothetical protein
MLIHGLTAMASTQNLTTSELCDNIKLEYWNLFGFVLNREEKKAAFQGGLFY